METNDIDNYIKKNIPEKTDYWDKNAAWNELNRKRDNRTIYKISVFISLAIISSFILFLNSGNSNSNNNLTELEKRQKLEEIEMKLYAQHEKNLICYNCNILEKEKIHRHNIASGFVNF